MNTKDTREDAGREEGIFFEGWIMTWVGAPEWIELVPGMKGCFRDQFSPGVGETVKLKSLRLVDKGIILKAP